MAFNISPGVCVVDHGCWAPLGCHRCHPENWTEEAIQARREAQEMRYKKHGDWSAPLTIREFDD